MQSEKINELATALSKVQSSLRPAVRSATNLFFHSKYAPLDVVWDACREVLGEHGFAVTQATTTSPTSLVVCIVGVSFPQLPTTTFFLEAESGLKPEFHPPATLPWLMFRSCKRPRPRRSRTVHRRNRCLGCWVGCSGCCWCPNPSGTRP